MVKLCLFGGVIYLAIILGLQATKFYESAWKEFKRLEKYIPKMDMKLKKELASERRKLFNFSRIYILLWMGLGIAILILFFVALTLCFYSCVALLVSAGIARGYNKGILTKLKGIKF